MKKVIAMIGFGAVLAVSQAAWAGTSSGCGLGSNLFKGQSGLLYNVLAATTNGSSGNQTFGMTSGTSGCKADDVVSIDKEAEVFVADNMPLIMNDAAQSSGEYLTAFSGLMGCSSADDAFVAAVQNDFDTVFASSKASDVITQTKAVIANDAVLSASCEL